MIARPCPFNSGDQVVISFHSGSRGFGHQVATDYLSTFLRVMTARHDAPIREPRGYLSAIARSLLIDKVRRRTIEQAYLQALALKPEPVDISPEVRLSIIETLVSIDSLLDELGPRTRDIFLAVQLEGLTYVAAAERFDVSVTTVKNHLIRAMTRCLLLVDS